MNDELNAYKNWNRALWNYFFPGGTGNAILYLDDGILGQIATEASFQLPYGAECWGDYLLGSSLLKGEQFERFQNQLRAIPQIPEPRRRLRTWDKLVELLMNGKFNNIPSYFAMLCSILYLAAKCGANHNEMRKGAQKYLGNDYHNSLGELVDPLLQQLHSDVPSFNQNRMICGNQRHMSRIKFHLVLPRSDRDDFIDFIEINNLRWNWEETSYSFYVENILVPSLVSARKNDLAYKVTRQENIPYFKSILQSDLEFGRATSQYNNIVQVKEIRWKYQLFFDYNGNYHFHILTDYVQPFGIEMVDGQFRMARTSYADYIAEDVLFKAYEPTEFTFEGFRYCFSNVSFGQREYGDVFFFKAVSDETYLQVNAPIEGERYYAFINEGFRTIPVSWTPIPCAPVNGFRIYEIASFSVRQRPFAGVRVKLEDAFCRQWLGSWYSIKLEENQDIYWLPNEIDSEPVHIVKRYKNANGMTYFRIPSKNPHYLSGTLIVKKGNRDILSEPLSAQFAWDGKITSFHMNGWGEIVPGELPELDSSCVPLRQAIIPGTNQSANPEPGILLQLIFESADEYGRLSKRKIEAAISFALSYYGETLTKENSRSIIHGLRRLGYVIRYVEGSQESYQLIAPYLEKTNFSISRSQNAYLVKGAYNQGMLSNLLSLPGIRNTIRIRPYEPETLKNHPEYRCLPDQILFETRSVLSWRTLDYPIAEQVLKSMENIDGFVHKFGIGQNGENYRGVPPSVIPGMVKISQGVEVLCTQQDGNYVIHPYYENEGIMKYIPKHLSRLYSQVQRKASVCIMAYNQPSRDVDYSHISFVNNMGVPEVLDIALCDLNLVIPSYKKVFIIDQDALGTKSRAPWTEMRSYGTHAMTNEHSFMLTWLSKLAGKRIADIKQNPDSIFVTRRRKDCKLFLTKNFSFHKDLLTLFDGDHLFAFALGQEVYCFETQSGLYKRVSGTDVNKILSSIICNKKYSLLDDVYKDSIEDVKHSAGKSLPILERVTF